jgi:hypothetical protein
MTCGCGCCGGSGDCTHGTISNLPGQSKIDFRLGGHDWFNSTMLGRLSSSDFPALAGLRTRDQSDFTVAYVDACSVVGDVLCFYQERIANEGYLATATERRSLVELSRLVGYAPKPGVAASTYLSYTVEKGSAPALIPKGSKVNSIPDPGQDMVTFETADPLQAREEWNAIKPRQTMPQSVGSIISEGLYLKGTASGLKAGDRLLFKFGIMNPTRLVANVMSIKIFDEANYSLVKFNFLPHQDTASIALMAGQEMAKIALAHNPSSLLILQANEKFTSARAEGSSQAFVESIKLFADPKSETEGEFAFGRMLSSAAEVLFGSPNNELFRSVETFKLNQMAAPLTLAETIAPSSTQTLTRNSQREFGNNSELNTRMLTHVQERLSTQLYTAWKALPPLNPVSFEVVALRTSARPFGHNAPLRVADLDGKKLPIWGEWDIDDPLGNGSKLGDRHDDHQLYLDSEYEIASDDLVVIDIPNLAEGDGRLIMLDSSQKLTVSGRSLAAYGLSGKTTSISWDDNGNAALKWIRCLIGQDSIGYVFDVVRAARVFAGHEKLELAERPIEDCVGGDTIELDQLYDGLDSGRWLVVAGERADVKDKFGKPIPGIMASELVMVAGSEQYKGKAEGETYRTRLKIAAIRPDGTPGLAYCYKRDSVSLNANVTKATHGETRVEVLGSGNAAMAWQKFELKQSPLTYVSSDTPSGLKSTLEVQVNGVVWHEEVSLSGETEKTRKFFTRTNDEQKTSAIFGDGKHGQRLPTGRENIRAIYRNGMGRSGNLKPGKLSLLASRPLGIKDVTNPVRSSGGADPETMGSIRSNAPLAIMALDRLVGVEDYEFFAQSFAGVSKASARLVVASRSRTVNVTICGDGDDPVEPGSDLIRDLRAALTEFGDLDLRIKLQPRRKLILRIAVNVKLGADYRWENEEPKIRATLVEAFGFERAKLGGSVFLSRVIATLQALESVDYVDVDYFDAISEQQALESFGSATALAPSLNDRLDPNAIPKQQDSSGPDSIVYLTPDIPDTLILQEIKS